MHEISGHKNQQLTMPVVGELLRTLTFVTSEGVEFPLNDSDLNDDAHQYPAQSPHNSLIVGRRKKLTSELGDRLLQLTIDVHNESSGQFDGCTNGSAPTQCLSTVAFNSLGAKTVQDDTIDKDMHYWGVINILVDGTIPVVGEYVPGLCNDEDLALAEELGIEIDPTTEPLGEHGWTPLLFSYDTIAVATLSDTIRYIFDESQ